MQPWFWNWFFKNYSFNLTLYIPKFEHPWFFRITSLSYLSVFYYLLFVCVAFKHALLILRCPSVNCIYVSYLFICCLSVCSSVLFVYMLSIRLFICMSVSVGMTCLFGLSICPYVHLSIIWMSVCLFVCLSPSVHQQKCGELVLSSTCL